MNKYSIVKQIAIINTFVMALFIGLFVMNNYIVVSNQFEQLESRKIDAILKNAAPVIGINYSLGIEQNYKDAIDDILQKNDEVVAVELLSQGEKIIYEKRKKVDGVSKISVLSYPLKDEILKTAIGWIKIEYKISNLYTKLLHDFAAFLWVMLVFFIITMFFSILLVSNSLKPLLRLKEKILGYSIEKRTDLSKMYGENEIALINNAVAEMFERIETEMRTRIEYENQMMQKSRLASMGEMMDNIAHQWRQPLMRMNAILLNIDRAIELDRFDKDYLLKKLQDGSETLLYMSQTIDTFREFINPNRIHAEFEISAALKEAIEFFQRSSENIEITIDVSQTLSIYGVKNELIQVILSILTNAKELFLEREISQPQIWINIFQEGSIYAITIEDNARGADESIIEKIFEPYFTTKFKSGGTGLGLYICKMIMTKSFHGDIVANNTKNGLKLTLKIDPREM
jgi:C4-dicarboxylate-specific signal transduction histidine kinase